MLSFLKGNKGKEQQPKLSDAEKDVKVASELVEARKCIEKNDNACTVAHLAEAQKHEDCPPCKRQIKEFKKNVPLLPREKQARKLELLTEYVQPAAGLSRKMKEMKAIKPSRTEKLKYSVKKTATKVGSGLKRAGGGIKSGLKGMKKRIEEW